MRKTLISWTLLFACNLMWSLQFTCIKLTQADMGPFFTVWGPMGLAAIFLAPFALRSFKQGGKKLKDILIFGQLAMLGAFPAQVLMTWGTQYSLASNAASASCRFLTSIPSSCTRLVENRIKPMAIKAGKKTINSSKRVRLLFKINS